MNSKSQSAVEFVILTGFVLFFFVIFFVSIQDNMALKLREKQDLALKDIVLGLQDEVNLAYGSSEGYSRDFNIPPNVNGNDYNISIISEMIYAYTLDKSSAVSFSIPKIIGQPIKNLNKIKKLNGEVYLN